VFGSGWGLGRGGGSWAVRFWLLFLFYDFRLSLIVDFFSSSFAFIRCRPEFLTFGLSVGASV
jgi:hypothetical protein